MVEVGDFAPGDCVAAVDGVAAATLDAVGQSAEETEACLGQLRADGYAQLLPLVVGRHQDDGTDH